jgi:hypothetical protein
MGPSPMATLVSLMLGAALCLMTQSQRDASVADLGDISEFDRNPTVSQHMPLP